jgi:hypothetical protein
VLDSKNVDLVCLDAIDEAEGTLQYLTKIGLAVLRQPLYVIGGDASLRDLCSSRDVTDRAAFGENCDM